MNPIDMAQVGSTPLDLDMLTAIAQKANEADREWRTGIERGLQCGYDLEYFFAACRAHRDNPRKNHFELAENDRKYLEAFNPSVARTLLTEVKTQAKRIEILEAALEEIAESKSLVRAYSDGTELYQSHDPSVTKAREALAASRKQQDDSKS